MAGEEKEKGEGKKSGNVKTMIIIAVAAVVTAVLSVVGTLFFLTDAEDTRDAGSAEEVHVPARYVTIERPLVVGIAGEARQRFLQVHVAFVVRDDDVADGVERHKPAIRSRLQSVLQREEYATLHTDEGKIALQETLLTAVNEVLETEGVAPVEKVLFTNFVMQ